MENINKPRTLIHKTLILLDELKVYKDSRFKTLISIYEIIGLHPLYGKKNYFFFTFCEGCDKDFDNYKYMITTIKTKNNWLKNSTILSVTQLQLPNGFQQFFGGNGLDRKRAVKAE